MSRQYPPPTHVSTRVVYLNVLPARAAVIGRLHRHRRAALSTSIRVATVKGHPPRPTRIVAGAGGRSQQCHRRHRTQHEVGQRHSAAVIVERREAKALPALYNSNTTSYVCLRVSRPLSGTLGSACWGWRPLRYQFSKTGRRASRCPLGGQFRFT